ncbi:MAG TPA: hypothetical protein EYH05_05360 [Anaerolineae bacterium]|nr:hypothetical protein [Anaerolineae bacterium]
MILYKSLDGSNARRYYRAGQYSIRVNEQWRICFEWYDGDAYDVELANYH